MGGKGTEEPGQRAAEKDHASNGCARIAQILEFEDQAALEENNCNR